MSYHWRLFVLVFPTLGMCAYDSWLSHTGTIRFYFAAYICIYVLRKEFEQYWKDKRKPPTSSVAVSPSSSPIFLTSNMLKFRSTLLQFSQIPTIAEGLEQETTITSSDQFTASIAEINQWFKRHNQSVLWVSEKISKDKTNIAILCRYLLIQLFTQHRDSRLYELINYMNTSVKIGDGPYILAKSLTNLVLSALGIPHDIQHYKKSHHQFVGTLFTNTFLAAQDYFVYDFILYNMIHHTQTDILLNQDIRKTNGVLKPKRRSTLPDFNYLPFMTPLPPPSTFELLKRVFGLSGGIFRSDQDHLEVQSGLVKDTVQVTLNKIDRIQCLLWNKSTRRQLACDTPVSSPHKDQSSFFQMGAIISPIESPLEHERPKEDQFHFTETVSITVEQEDNDTDETSWPYIHYKRSNPEDRGMLSYGTMPVLFKDTIAPLRATQISVLETIQTLLKSESMTLLNQLQTLIKAGYAYDDAENDLKRVRQSLEMLKLNYQTFEDHVQEYKKGFVLHQLTNYLKMYQSEIEMIETNNIRFRKENAYDEIVSISKIGGLTKNVAWSLKYVYERFATFDPAYKKKAYRKLVNDLHHTIYLNVDHLCDAYNIKEIKGKQPMR